MSTISPRIICCYLYPITKYGYPPDANHALRYLEEMAALGFQSVELEGIRESHLGIMYDLRFSIRERMDALALEVPYYCIVLPGLSSPEAAERKANLALFEKGCQTAQVLGAGGVLDNAPLPPWRFPADIPVTRHYDEEVLAAASLPPELNWNRYWQEMTATYREACDIAAQYGLSYHMHPCHGVLAATTDSFLYFADAVDRDNLRFNLDTANQFFLRDNLALSLIRLADRIDYIHLSDNRGQHVEHLVPGDGSIPWESFFEALDKVGFQGHFGIDVGGAETGIEDLDQAYLRSVNWLQSHLQLL